MRTLMSALVLVCLLTSGCNQPVDKEKPKTPAEKPKKAPPSNGSGYRL